MVQAFLAVLFGNALNEFPLIDATIPDKTLQ